MQYEEPISSFIFNNEDDRQIFQHQFYAAGKMHECHTCYSNIDADEPSSQHWLRKGEEQRLQLSKQQKAVLDIIEARQIETFFFCDESTNDKLHHFLAESCFKAIPELLRWMFHNGTKQLEFNLSCYVNVFDQVFIFQSGTLCVQHHYDIEECVSVLLEMITQRIENYLSSSHYVCLNECSITRLRVQLKRIRDDNESSASNRSSSIALPLKLRFETPVCTTTSEAELASLHAAYVKYRRDCNGYFPSNMRANLFGLQQCATTKEIYVAPYHISETLQQQPNKNFLILNDVMGEFQCLHELPNPLAAADDSQVSAHALQCPRCRTQFRTYSRLHIHQQLRCGQDFSVDSMHPDIVEIYEQCLPISRSIFQYNCYGITRSKTVMQKGKFVPIECDWRAKSSVQVQRGPCVIISNCKPNSPSKY